MDSLALISLLVCGAVGAGTLLVGWRWLTQASKQPPPRPPRAVPLAPPAAPPAESPAPVVKPAALEDEPTQPMMRTSWDLPLPRGADGSLFAPTEPMPLKRE